MSLVINKGKNPHLAITHEKQGYSANLRPVSLLMKSEYECTEEVVKALQNLGVEVDITKAMFYSQMRTMLQNSIKDKFGSDDEYSWLYVEDFNDSVVIFCNEKGLWMVEHSLVSGEVVLSDLATPVTGVLNYVPASGKMLLSEDAEDKLEEGVYSLMVKALENTTTKEHLIEMFKSKEKEVTILQEEIQKAVLAAEEVLKAQLKEKDETLEKALSKVAEFEKAQKEAVEKSRKEAIAAVEKDEAKAAELYKSLEPLSDEAFTVVVKSLKAKEDKLEDSDLFVQKSKNSDVERDEVNGTAAILKAKYAKQ